MVDYALFIDNRIVLQQELESIRRTLDDDKMQCQSVPFFFSFGEMYSRMQSQTSFNDIS